MLSKDQIFIGKILAASLLLFSSPTYAAFSIHGKQESTNQTSTKKPTIQSLQPYVDTYGNAEATSFNNAINGNNIDLSEEEKKELLRTVPQQNYDRWCARVSFNIGKIELRHLTNKTNKTAAVAGLKVNKKSTNKNHTGLEFAMGYVFPNWRAEAEYLVNSSLGYSQNPLFQASAGSIRSTIKGSTVLGTLYYEFLEPGEFFHPFLAGSLGISLNKVTSTFSGFAGDGVTNSKVTNKMRSLAFGGSLGFRMQVYSQLHLQAAVRYVRLGRISVKDQGGFTTLKLKGNRNLILGSFGFMVLI